MDGLGKASDERDGRLVRWLVANGQIDDEPDAEDWHLYRLFEAAELLRCKVWELAEQPESWIESAFWFDRIRGQVQEALIEVERKRLEHAEKEFAEAE